MNWLRKNFLGPRNLLWILQLAVLKIDSRMRDISKRQIVSHWIDGKRWTKNKYWDGQKGHSRPKYRFAVHLCTVVKDGVKKYPTIIYKDFFIVLHNYNPLLNINHNYVEAKMITTYIHILGFKKYNQQLVCREYDLCLISWNSKSVFFIKNFRHIYCCFSLILKIKLTDFCQKIGRITAQTYNSCLMYWKFEGLIKKLLITPLTTVPKGALRSRCIVMDQIRPNKVDSCCCVRWQHCASSKVMTKDVLTLNAKRV